MKRIFLILALLLGFSWIVKASDSGKLYLPLNIKKAYDQGTRSYDGNPGAKYWQNHSRYSIQAKFNPSTNILIGHEIIVYKNESPDTLQQLVLRLYQDFFKKGNLRDWPVAVEDLHNGVQIENLKINNRPVDLKNSHPSVRRYGTNLTVLIADTPLVPDGKITLEFNWQLHIPRKTSIRMGTYDSTSFFIGYWYPQMAVYDDIEGWDTYNFSGLQEFYNDFSDYDVTVTVPKNFVVWATGRLQNPSEVLRPKILERYLSAFKKEAIVHVITEKDLQEGNITAANDSNTFHFKAYHVPDFAFATSDHYLWDLSSLKLNTSPVRRVLIGAAYKDSAGHFDHVAEIAKKSVQYYSTEMPTVPFPYPSLTIFNGGGGMEYPMMVNESAINAWSSTVHVTTHEISHSYFPFMMGINERKYAWMDEGWATMLPFTLQHRLAPEYDPIKRTVQRYLQIAGSEYDIPMIVPTIVYGANARVFYRNESYNRPGIAYYLLEQMVGKDQFVKIMQEYIKRWQGKHPGPFDFFFTVNNVLNEDLSWFWKPWFFDFGYPDLALSLNGKKKDEIIVKVQKKGLLPVPICLQVQYADSSEEKIKKSINVWQNGTKAVLIPIKIKKPISQIILGNSHIPDVFKQDNVLKLK